MGRHWLHPTPVISTWNKSNTQLVFLNQFFLFVTISSVRCHVVANALPLEFYHGNGWVPGTPFDEVRFSGFPIGYGRKVTRRSEMQILGCKSEIRDTSRSQESHFFKSPDQNKLISTRTFNLKFSTIFISLPFFSQYLINFTIGTDRNGTADFYNAMSLVLRLGVNP